MSKGTPIIPLRVPVELMAEVDAKIARSQDSARGEPYTRTSWILAAIRERLAKQARSNRRPRPARRRAVAGDGPLYERTLVTSDRGDSLPSADLVEHVADLVETGGTSDETTEGEQGKLPGGSGPAEARLHP